VLQIERSVWRNLKSKISSQNGMEARLRCLKESDNSNMQVSGTIGIQSVRKKMKGGCGGFDKPLQPGAAAFKPAFGRERPQIQVI
jgi:hypothetical protein